MVVDITSKEEQKLLGRTKVTANASFDGATPKKMKIRKDLAQALKVKDEQIIVRHIHTSYGRPTATVEAMVYDKAEAASVLEHKKLMEKHTKKEEPAKKEEAPKAEPEKAAPAEEAKAEEKPAEEKKEEAVEEKAEEKSE